MSSTSLSNLIRQIVEALIDEYKNAEKPDFIDWNLDDNFDEEIG